MKRTTAKRAIVGLLGTAAVGVTLAVAPTGPANAYPVDQGQDFAEHNSAGNWFRVCDRESDDHSVWAEFHDNTGPQRKSKPVDYDSADNCGRYEAAPGVT